MAKTVDQLLIEIKAETSQLQKDLKQVKSKLLSTEIGSEVIPEQDVNECSEVEKEKRDGTG